MLLGAAALSLLLAGLFFLLLRVGAPRWTLVLLGVLPSVLLLVCLPNLRIYGYHGWVQAGIVYQILQGHIPPQNPLLAGEPGTYPWISALLLAGISKTLGVSPFWSATIVAIGSLAVLLVLTYQIGRLATGDTTAAVFGVATSLYAFTFTQSVPETPLRRFITETLRLPYEPRGAPLLEKFNGCTGFPLGLALYALALLCLLRMAAERRSRPGLVAGLLVGVVGVGFVYPFFFIPAALLCLTTGALAWRISGTSRGQLAVIGGVLALAAAAVAPYYLQLARGRAGPVLRIAPPDCLLRGAGVLLVTLLPMSLLLTWARVAVREIMRERGAPAAILGISVVSNLLLFAGLSAPLWSQYKFLLLGTYALGIIGGVAFRVLYVRTWPVALLVFSAFLLSFGLDCVHKATAWRKVAEPYCESGVSLDHADPAEAELYRWIRSRTPPGSVFVDSKLSVPVFGQRSLFVAMPATKNLKAYTTTPGDGYTLDLRIILRVVDGYPETLVTERQRIAARLLSGRLPTAAELAALRAAGPKTYLITRTPSLGSRIARLGSFPMAFRSSAFAVWDLSRIKKIL
jgi:hypothetical protein